LARDLLPQPPRASRATRPFHGPWTCRESERSQSASARWCWR
jgi:hypothetical protein